LAFIASDEPSNYTLSNGIDHLDGYVTDQSSFLPQVQTGKLAAPDSVDVDLYPAYFTENARDITPLHTGGECGIKAWEIRLGGKPFVLIANNLKWRNGTFSYTEDAFYYKILHYARVNRLPFVYIASNSGADINLNEGVKFMAKPWGTEYLYLTREDYDRVKNQVQADFHPERGHYIIRCINNKGIVNLDGSALLVSEMAKARQEIPTFTFVIDRTVGVGAYLAKLSERIVQLRDASIILTGYQALNKVLGNNLYESNLQLGGPQIMGANGISQKIVDTTGEGFAYLKTMLSFVLAPVMPPPGEVPAKDLMGHIIDAGTFLETMHDYAKTVITGRARIGGQAYAVVYNNEAVTEKFIPCDPANLATEVSYLKQSPNILYPDTSYKIAKTIQTANMEGLPLLLICDWRGFSGGTRDMYANVLDFGSMIVTELTAYKQKIWVYIPPYGQLRGGSMVVFSKSINPEWITLCVSKHAKINVLEPNAAKELKYKQKDIEKYAVKHNITMETADKIALMYTELNDVVNSDYTILEQADAPKIIDYVIEPFELRQKILSLV
jgi:acetyl-CoA carboxylase/biotin carboxylase 1